MNTQRPDDSTAPDDSTDPDNPLGGDEVTESGLEADNAAEEDMLKTLDPDAAPA